MWNFINQQVGFNITPEDDTPLSKMLQLKLEKNLEPLTQVSNQARKEYALEKVGGSVYKNYKLKTNSS